MKPTPRAEASDFAWLTNRPDLEADTTLLKCAV